jgi:hypothetical protein
LNASERVKRDQVGVAGDNVFRFSTYGKFQELIVLWIAAGDDLNLDVDPFGFASQSGKKASNVFLMDVTAELLSTKNFVKFSENRKSEENFPSP